MKFNRDNMSLLRHALTLIVGAAVAYGVVTTTVKAHIENTYVHNDLQTLDQTYVRKDILALELKSMNDKLGAITKELGITQ